MWFAWLLACAGPEPKEEPSPEDTWAPTAYTETDTPPVDTDPGEETDTVPPADTATVPPPPNIADVLGDCGGSFEEPDEYPNQLQPGDDLHEVVLADPAALCNDGSPAVLYVRAATDPAHAGDWALHLQGGSDCTDFEACSDRYCGAGYYDASKTSSRWTPLSIAGNGLQSTDARNQFAGWNQVYFYYCSSDDWQGTSSATMTSEDGLTSFTIERRGHAIIEAGIAALEAGVTSGDGVEALPSILEAETVLFTGTSAGSIGAQSHLDWLRDRWPAEIGLLGVFDAAVAPEPTTVDPTVSATIEAMARARYDDASVGAAPIFADATCEAGTDPADRYECTMSEFLPYHWVETPFLARMDHFDDPTGSIYVSAGATVDDFAVSVSDSLALLDPLPQAGAFGPSCGQHLGLEETSAFLAQPIATPDGPLTLQDAILEALEGIDVYANDVAYDLSTCAP